MSKPSKSIKLVVKHGQIKAIYDDALMPLMAEGEVTIRRASHVEPHTVQWGDGMSYWQADMSPVGGPILTGFETRAEALAAEVEYLKRKVIT